MGIKHLNKFINKYFSQYITDIKVKDNFSIDNQLIDLNCIIHYSAQKTYRYGMFKEIPNFFNFEPSIQLLNIILYKDVCKIILDILMRTNPRKRIFIAIDGPAPLAKQNQQRQRRFKAAKEQIKNKDIKISSIVFDEVFNIILPEFNSSQISPGTEFMYNLSEFITKWIRDFLLKEYSGREIFFSNERVPGEGEYKCMEFIRKCLDESKYKESFCINGPDADLYMLTLGTLIPDFYIIKENLFRKGELNPHKMIYSLYNMKSIRDKLLMMLRKNTIDTSEDNNLIYDFIIFCFFVGNDFVPALPTIDIINNGLETMIEINKTLSSHFIDFEKKEINIETLYEFCVKLGKIEKDTLIEKYSNEEKFIEDDEIFHDVLNFQKEFEIEIYKQKYLEIKIQSEEKDVVQNYVDGLNWILRYYFYGIIDWDYIYYFSYAPFASMIAINLSSYKIEINLKKTYPSPPYLQLLAILPPQSYDLIPEELNKIMFREDMKKYYPTEIEIDYQGKRKEFEGIIILPFINMKELKEIYEKEIKNLNKNDIKRNEFSKTIKWKNGFK